MFKDMELSKDIMTAFDQVRAKLRGGGDSPLFALF